MGAVRKVYELFDAALTLLEGELSVQQPHMSSTLSTTVLEVEMYPCYGVDLPQYTRFLRNVSMFTMAKRAHQPRSIVEIEPGSTNRLVKSSATRRDVPCRQHRQWDSLYM